MSFRVFSNVGHGAQTQMCRNDIRLHTGVCKMKHAIGNDNMGHGTWNLTTCKLGDLERGDLETRHLGSMNCFTVGEGLCILSYSIDIPAR